MLFCSALARACLKVTYWNTPGHKFINKYNAVLAQPFLFNCFIIVILSISLACDNSVLL
jgi:hypothetical protein